MNTAEQQKITFIEPEPYSEVEASFKIYGILPQEWLPSDGTTSLSLYINILNGVGKNLAGSSIHFNLSEKPNIGLTDGLKFVYEQQLNPAHLHFIQKTDGRMVIKLSGHEERQFTYLPLVIKNLKPAEGANPLIVEKHLNIERTVSQYQKNAEEYQKELGKILERRQKGFEAAAEDHSELYTRIKNEGFAKGIFEILEYSEDVEMKELEEKYKETIDWTGSLLRGRVGMLNGYIFQVYSDDHGQHFHVIHRERGVNARFSFPEIQLMSYKNSLNTINSKDQKCIKNYFQNPNNFQKLEKEFQKRKNL